ncbi:MAG TPA: peptidylprolyl isomerase [Candidatus Binatia bacterium]|nr:peptidylprolyl isomerase [Candidatus Binatia bacterium]
MSRRVTVLLSLLALVVSCRRAGEEGGAAGSKAAPAAEKAEPGADEVVATYAGHRLTRGQVLQELERLPGPSRAYLAAPERKRQFVENMILNDLLFEEGKTDGYDRDPDVERQVNDLRKRLVVQKVMRKYQTPPEITDEQARAYYDENKALYSTTQVRASHILVKDEDTAKQILAELRAHPERFAEIAKEKSIDTASAAKGGDLGLFGPGRMVPDFERVAFALDVGKISDVVKTQYGYHIIMVTERKEGEQKPFEQVKEQIKATLRNRALQDQVQHHFDALKREAGVQVDDAELAKVTPPAASAAPQPTLLGH